jgi:hypothetical protein
MDARRTERAGEEVSAGNRYANSSRMIGYGTENKGRSAERKRTAITGGTTSAATGLRASLIPFDGKPNVSIAISHDSDEVNAIVSGIGKPEDFRKRNCLYLSL